MKTLAQGSLAVLLACLGAAACGSHYEKGVPQAPGTQLGGGGGSGGGAGGAGGGGSLGKPNLLLVVDRSSSMAWAVDTSYPGCSGCGSSACPGICARTRMKDLQSALQGFLTGDGAVSARLGYVPFPTTNACGTDPIGSLTTLGVALTTAGTDVEADLRDAGVAIDSKIQALSPGGSSPVAATLTALAGYDALRTPGRAGFVLLVTDGAPVCNSALNVNACTCSVPIPPLSPCGSNPDSNLCLDNDGSASAASALKGQGVRTIVVGFGPEAADGGLTPTLSAVAEAGGFSRLCPNGTDEECAPGTCLVASHTCSVRYFVAADRDALTAALSRISALLPQQP